MFFCFFVFLPDWWNKADRRAILYQFSGSRCIERIKITRAWRMDANDNMTIKIKVYRDVKGKKNWIQRDNKQHILSEKKRK